MHRSGGSTTPAAGTRPAATPLTRAVVRQRELALQVAQVILGGLAVVAAIGGRGWGAAGRARSAREGAGQVARSYGSGARCCGPAALQRPSASGEQQSGHQQRSGQQAAGAPVVGAHVGLGPRAQLAHAQAQQLAPHLGALARAAGRGRRWGGGGGPGCGAVGGASRCGPRIQPCAPHRPIPRQLPPPPPPPSPEDHAGVRHRDAQDGHQLLEVGVVHGVRRRQRHLRASRRRGQPGQQGTTSWCAQLQACTATSRSPHRPPAQRARRSRRRGACAARRWCAAPRRTPTPGGWRASGWPAPRTCGGSRAGAVGVERARGGGRVDGDGPRARARTRAGSHAGCATPALRPRSRSRAPPLPPWPPGPPAPAQRRSLVVVEAVEDAQPHVVQPRPHRAVVRQHAVVVVWRLAGGWRGGR